MMKFFTRLIVFLVLLLVLAVLVPAAYLNRQITQEQVRAELLTLNSVAPDVLQIQMTDFKHHWFSTEVKYVVISTQNQASPLFNVTQTIEPGWLPLSRLARFQLKPVAAYSTFTFQNKSGEFQSSTPTVDVTVFFDKTQEWHGQWDQLSTHEISFKNLNFTVHGNGFYVRPNRTSVSDFSDAFDVVSGSQQKFKLQMDMLSSQDGQDQVVMHQINMDSNTQNKQHGSKIDSQSEGTLKVGQMNLLISGNLVQIDKLSNTTTQEILNLDASTLQNLPDLLNNPGKALALLLRTPLRIGLDTKIDHLHIVTDNQKVYNFNNAHSVIDINLKDSFNQKLSQTLTVDNYDLFTQGMSQARELKNLDLAWDASMVMFQEPYTLKLSQFNLDNAKGDPLVRVDNGSVVLDRHGDTMQAQVHVVSHQDNALDDPSLMALSQAKTSEFTIVYNPNTHRFMVNGQPSTELQSRLLDAWFKYIFPDFAGE